MPEFDRESGSRRVYNLIEFLVEAGWQVSFAARQARDGARYARLLQQRGIATYTGFGDRIGLFAGIDDVRFKRIVAPGDTLRLEVTMEKLGSRFGKGRGVATVAGEVACEGLLSFIIPPEGALR